MNLAAVHAAVSAIVSQVDPNAPFAHFPDAELADIAYRRMQLWDFDTENGFCISAFQRQTLQRLAIEYRNRGDVAILAALQDRLRDCRH